MPNLATNVTVGKPKASGGVYSAPTGTALPTDATTALNAAFTSLGYCSDDGLTNSIELENAEIKAWGGDTVLTVRTSRPINQRTWSTPWHDPTPDCRPTSSHTAVGPGDT